MAGPGSALELLHPTVREAVCRLGWQNLYPIQEEAIKCILNGTDDLIVSAPTSGGKTEAVFLPVLSQMLESPGPSLEVLCVSPLKALINDQYARLTNLCQGMGIAVHRWHGDVDQRLKKQLRHRPRGILFVTPESLESSFVNHGHQVLHLYSSLRCLVIDELHCLLDTERGIHVRSLISRLTGAIGRRPRCFGLSATLGDADAARAFLNLDHPESVRLIHDRSTARPIQVSIIGCLSGAAIAGTKTLPEVDNTESQEPENGLDTTSQLDGLPTGIDGMSPLHQIARDVDLHFRGSTNLVFANSRKTVELLADILGGRDTVDAAGESEFVLHHGSLSARVRHRSESLLKSGEPVNGLCTSSLELGIDIGAISTVAQIDPPASVSSLTQRLGRSGRREGTTCSLRFYVRPALPSSTSSLSDLLNPKVLQSVAMVNLLLQGWLEPQSVTRPHLSTLVHQTLSLLKETGGQTAVGLYRTLCQRGPFRYVSPADFRTLLQGLREHKLADQDSEGTIILGTSGERITSAPSFYAAFATPIELAVRHGSEPIGRLPISFQVKEEECLLLNGRRWEVQKVDWKAKSIWVVPTERKKAPVFLGTAGDIHSRVFEEMRVLLRGHDEPKWIDSTCRELLQSARETAGELGLDRSDLLEENDGLHWFPWVGTKIMNTLELWAKSAGLNCSRQLLCLHFEGICGTELSQHLACLINTPPDPVELAALMNVKQRERFDAYIPEALLDKANAADRLDLDGAREAACHIQ